MSTRKASLLFSEHLTPNIFFTAPLQATTRSFKTENSVELVCKARRNSNGNLDIKMDTRTTISSALRSPDAFRTMRTHATYIVSRGQGLTSINGDADPWSMAGKLWICRDAFRYIQAQACKKPGLSNISTKNSETCVRVSISRIEK